MTGDSIATDAGGPGWDWDVALSRGSAASVAFGGGSAILATGSDDGAVLLWDVADRLRRLGDSQGPTGPVSSVAFSADGRTLATSSADNTVIVWNVSALVQLRADAVAAACQRVGSDLTRPKWEAITPGRPHQHTYNGRRTEGG
jgi:WD40 repeat protein